MKLIKWLDNHFEEAILVMLLVLIACVELVQVIVRNIPWIPSLTWAEEFCRFCWIWSVFASLPYTIRKASMLRVSVILDAFPRGIKNGLNIFVDLVNSGIMLFLGIHSVSVVQSILESGEKSPAMLWPMWIVYGIMIFGFFMGVIRGIQQVILHIRHWNDKGLSAKEQAEKDAREEINAAKQAESLGRAETVKGGEA